MTTASKNETANTALSQRTLVIVGSILLYCAFSSLVVLALGNTRSRLLSADSGWPSNSCSSRLPSAMALEQLGLVGPSPRDPSSILASVRGMVGPGRLLGCNLPLSILTRACVVSSLPITAFHRIQRCLVELGTGAKLLCDRFWRMHVGAHGVNEPWLLQIAAHLAPTAFSPDSCCSLLLLPSRSARPDIANGKTKIGVRLPSALPALFLFLGSAIYLGRREIAEADLLAKNQPPLASIALIQENAPTIFEANPDRNARSWSTIWNPRESHWRNFLTPTTS